MSNQVLLKKSSVVAKVPTSGDLSYGEVALNYADGKLYFKNSSNTVQPLGIAYTKIIANTTAKINQGYICNTGAGSFTLTLPASPETGHYVIISDDNAFGTNPLYVDRNGNPIAGIAENLTIDITGVSVTLLWDGGSWNVYSQVGATGGSGSGGTSYNFSSFPQGLIPDYDNTYTLGNSTYKWNYVNSYGYRFGDNTTQTTAAVADGSSITNSGGTITANAGSLAGSTLSSGVTASSLQTLGTQTQRINWQGSGVAAPQFTSSSVGSKLILYPAVGASYADYAIGIDSATIWNGVPANDVNYFFKWYGGTTNIASLTGTGNFTLAGTLAVNSPTISTTSSGTASVFNANATTLNIGGAATTVSIGAATGTLTINNANTVITGNLTVNGTTTTVNSTTVTVDDINIELGSVASPTDVTAAGGGITLKGATDKTISWGATNGWTSSEDINVASGKIYRINGTSVLNATTLGSGVTGSSLTSVGTIGTGTWQGTAVGLTYGGTGKTTAPAAMANLMGYTSTATAAGTTTLTNTSSYYQQFTGSTTQTVALPVTSTLQTGWTFHIVNNSTGNLSVVSSGLNAVITVIPGTTAMCTCIGTTLTTAADWESGITDFSTITGTGNAVLSTSPTLTTPTLGVATATSINGLTVSTTTGTLTLANSSTLATSGAFSTTLTATATTTLTLPTTGTLATLAGTETFTNKTLTSPTLTTPALGVATATSINKVAITAPLTGSTLTIADGKTLTASNTLTFTGTDASSVAFGTGGTVLYSGGALGTPSSGTLTNATGLPVSGITASTSTALGVGSIELGHATDTTIARSSAGVISVEGVVVPTVSSTNTLTNKTLTSPTINAGALSGTFSGNHTLSGDVNITGALTLPNRPAFRVVGNGGAITATTTVTSSNWTLDYQQGSALNTTTGIFTAPVAGLYQVNLVIRTNSNTSGTISQAIVRKTAVSGGAVTAQIMVEFAANTTMNHAGGSTITKMEVGDTLKLDVTAGTLSFDGNDNWSVAFIG